MSRLIDALIALALGVLVTVGAVRWVLTARRSL